MFIALVFFFKHWQLVDLPRQALNTGVAFCCARVFLLTCVVQIFVPIKSSFFFSLNARSFCTLGGVLVENFG